MIRRAYHLLQFATKAVKTNFKYRLKVKYTPKRMWHTANSHAFCMHTGVPWVQLYLSFVQKSYLLLQVLKRPKVGWAGKHLGGGGSWVHSLTCSRVSQGIWIWGSLPRPSQPCYQNTLARYQGELTLHIQYPFRTQFTDLESRDSSRLVVALPREPFGSSRYHRLPHRGL